MTELVDNAVEQPIVYDDPNKCVKNEPEAGPCMCPECVARAVQGVVDGKDSYIPKGIVLTDNNLVTQDPSQRVAYHFICTSCGKPNIGDYMSYCPDCGMRVIIRSHKVLQFLRYYGQQNSKVI